jgi:hypothetical protein
MIFTGSALVGAGVAVGKAVIYTAGVVAVALGLTGCADSDLENANLRIENTKMCMEIAEKRGYSIKDDSIAFNEKDKECYVLKTIRAGDDQIIAIYNLTSDKSVEFAEAFNGTMISQYGLKKDEKPKYKNALSFLVAISREYKINPTVKNVEDVKKKD